MSNANTFHSFKKKKTNEKFLRPSPSDIVTRAVECRDCLNLVPP